MLNVIEILTPLSLANNYLICVVNYLQDIKREEICERKFRIIFKACRREK